MAQEQAPRSIPARLRHSILGLADRFGMAGDAGQGQQMSVFEGTSIDAASLYALGLTEEWREQVEQHRKAEKNPIALQTGHAEQARSLDDSEDTVLKRDDLWLYGVFDGMGGESSGGVASQAAARGIHESYSQYTSGPETKDEALERMKTAFRDARTSVRESLNALEEASGGTTAIVAKFEVIQDELFLIWGNAGDSRLFVQQGHKNSIESLATEQIDEEPGQRHYVTNAMTEAEGNPRDVQDEFNIVKLGPNTRVMLCSDGITGDEERHFLSAAEMQEGFEEVFPQDAANKFVELSKKVDDKSVIVIDVLTGMAAVNFQISNSWVSNGPTQEPVSPSQPEAEQFAQGPYAATNFYKTENLSKAALFLRLQQLFEQGRGTLNHPLVAAKVAETQEKLSSPDNRRQIARAAIGMMATGAALYGATKLISGRRKRGNL